ncbi:hypothetical protein GMD78_19855 [Ornithinibacillus sp. L9]|uniref:Uncharacterized protein n=1 Tax=Ornithinibacillus caprae TaxID=2678566 RepID=A0A6N8FP04_9BACI|nr:hypothetical protein [Ornithinibacillus caprae]MUK90616.1 hypothetical protein [Ornithinibacillus caprae]
MKKYIIFIISFLILFSLFQVLSGLFLTYVYTPDIAEAWGMGANLSQEVAIKSSQSPFLFTLFLALLSATIAYFIPELTKYSTGPSK